jgi:hypothetical protein
MFDRAAWAAAAWWEGWVLAGSALKTREVPGARESVASCSDARRCVAQRREKKKKKNDFCKEAKQ